MALLKTEGLTYVYSQGTPFEKKAINNVNLEIEKGEFIGVIGHTGSGKSTLLNILGGIDSADGGYISIDGEKIEEMSEKELTLYRRKHLGYVFQMYNLIPNLNIRENEETKEIDSTLRISESDGD